jgi:hypothetical protein
MTDLMQKALKKFEAARPISGTLPGSEEEWEDLQDAVKDLTCAMYVDAGLTEADAKKLSEYAYGGSDGRWLTELCYRFWLGKP